MGALERAQPRRKHLSRCLFLLKPKPNPRNTPGYFDALCVMCVSQVCAGARCGAACQVPQFSEVLQVLFDSGAHLSSAYNCFTVYICMNVAERHLACQKLLVCRAAAVPAQLFFVGLMRDGIYYSNKKAGSLLTEFSTDGAVHSFA